MHIDYELLNIILGLLQLCGMRMCLHHMFGVLEDRLVYKNRIDNRYNISKSFFFLCNTGLRNTLGFIVQNIVAHINARHRYIFNQSLLISYLCSLFVTICPTSLLYVSGVFYEFDGVLQLRLVFYFIVGTAVSVGFATCTRLKYYRQRCLIGHKDISMEDNRYHTVLFINA